MITLFPNEGTEGYRPKMIGAVHQREGFFPWQKRYEHECFICQYIYRDKDPEFKPCPACNDGKTKSYEPDPAPEGE